jgi:N-acetylmuramic acid 6-phosphate etherase
MAMGYFLGVDGGGTKTAAVLLSGDNREIARAVRGPSNYHSVGLPVAEAALREAIHQVLASAGLTATDVTAIGLGMAGVGRPGDQRVVQDMLSHIARFRRVVITHDAEVALIGGVGHRHGAVLIAGTGATAYGVNTHGAAWRADGWGYLVGDEGSAYWIGVEGLRAAARAHDGRGPATALEDLLVSHLGLSDADALVTLIYADASGSKGQVVPRLANLAPLVSHAARGGDTVAQAILQEAGRRLSNTLNAVVRGLNMTNEAFEAVLMGGVLRARDLVWKTVTVALKEIAPRARVIEPRHDAAVGAALLAQQAGEERVEKEAEEPGESGEGNGKKEAIPITETRNPRTAAIDTLSSLEIVKLINDEDAGVAPAVRQELPQIARAMDVIVERLRQGGRLLYFGAGTSGRLGVLDASEIPPTFNASPDLVQGFIAGGDVALRRSVEAAEDDAAAGAQVVRDAGVNEADVAVGITASGGAPWVLSAVTEARRRGAATVAITCNPDSLLARLVEVVIAPVVGPEVVAGSSRMKAGTAQKMVLNMLSTATMIRLGKVYDNLMVDVQPTNVKLRHRAIHILREAAGVDSEAARRALKATEDQIKPALVMLLTGVDADEARQRLAAAKGFVRRAVKGL